MNKKPKKEAPQTSFAVDDSRIESLIIDRTSQKNYVLDTNVLLHDPGCFLNFTGNHVYIPITVLEELDHLKSKDGLLGYQAREAVRTLHRRIDGRDRKSVV